jgi:ribosomal-protein-alanine N-acetyltransferase
MFEALSAAIDYAFRELNIHRIMANHLLDNERSARLLQRLGFVREGVAKDYLRIDGVWRDHVLNSLTNAQWVER